MSSHADVELERRLGDMGRRGRRAVVAGLIRGEEHLYGCRFPRGRPADERSLFEIGSVTKAFTGVVLADMVLAGEVALDAADFPTRPGRWSGARGHTWWVCAPGIPGRD